MPLLVTPGLPHFIHDTSPGQGILQCIGQKIQSDLLHPQIITQNIVVFHLLHLYIKGKTLLFHPGPKELLRLLHGSSEVTGTQFDFQTPLFQSGHIQYIIDQSAQMAAGPLHFKEVFHHLPPVIHMIPGKTYESDNGIHRSLNIMRNIKEKR